MRICLLTSSYPRSPNDYAGVFVREFALGLRDQGHEVSIFTPAKEGKIISDPGLDVHAFPWWGKESILTRLSLAHPLNWVRLAHLWRAGSKDILTWGPSKHFDRLLAFWAIPSGWFGRLLHRRIGIPFDVYVLGSDIWRRNHYPFGNWVVQRVLREADRVFADGTDLVQQVETIAHRPAHLLRMMRRLPLVSPVATLKPGPCHFVFVGRWDHVKGLDVFVDAFLGLGAGPYEAHIFGEGPQADWLFQRLKDARASHVHVYGLVSPEVLSGYLRACDFAVISSRQESLPVVFFDAMQAGLPVIASDVGDLRSIVEKYRVGLIVPSDDIQALQQAMQQAAISRKSPWEQSCKELAATLDPSHMVTEYLQKITSPPDSVKIFNKSHTQTAHFERPFHEKKHS